MSITRNNRTTRSDSADDFIAVARKASNDRSEGLNPRIYCGEAVPEKMLDINEGN